MHSVITRRGLQKLSFKTQNTLEKSLMISLSIDNFLGEILGDWKKTGFVIWGQLQYI